MGNRQTERVERVQPGENKGRWGTVKGEQQANRVVSLCSCQTDPVSVRVNFSKFFFPSDVVSSSSLSVDVMK